MQLAAACRPRRVAPRGASDRPIPGVPQHLFAKRQIASVAVMGKSSEKWLEGAVKVGGQFNGGHAKWAPETTKAEVEK